MQAHIKKRKILQDQGIYVAHVVNFNRNAKLQCEIPVTLHASSVNMQGRIGAYTYIQHNVRLAPRLKSIGRYCFIAQDAVIGDSNHPMDWLSTNPFQYGNSSLFNGYHQGQDFDFLKFTANREEVIHIGHDVWIGRHAIVLQGVRIGHGAIVSDGSVVTRDVPPYAIVEGIPARITGYRFTAEIIERLLSLAWWDYQADSLMQIQFDQIDTALVQLQTLIQTGQLKRIDAKHIVTLAANSLFEAKTSVPKP